MFRTLYGKLALILFGIFCVTGGVFLITGLYSAHMYQQEVAQRLNRDLAGHIVEDHLLFQDGTLSQPAMEDLFHTLMVINPSVELYLLDPQGGILAYSAAPEKVRRTRVSLEPVRRTLGSRQSSPVFGDDPRNPTGTKVFSVAPIESNGKLQGYLYAILGGEQVDHIAQLLQRSYILRWGAITLGAGLIFAFATALILFAALTRRLRILNRSMEAFRHSNFSESPPFAKPDVARPDEIDQIGMTFSEMADRIHLQLNRLSETDALRRELVANVSHDLRTPLASLKGYLETLRLKESSLSDDERRQYLETAERHAQRLSKLVEELFELAKLDAMEVKPNPEPFSPAELIHDVMQKFQLRAKQRGINLEIDVQPDAPFAEADIGMIERVLDNLIENALHHTPEGGAIRLALTVNDDSVTVKVIDTGQGIPDDELPYIFERFYRKTSPGNGSGAGLGLAIAQRIVELHGGKLRVDSAMNRGSAFAFNLPIHDFAQS